MRNESPTSGDLDEPVGARARWFATFMRYLPGLAWIKDLDGRYVFVNDAAERDFGKTRAELYGRTDEEIFPPRTAEQFRANDRLALDGATGVETIETLEHGDGVHHSLVTKFPIPGPDGRPALVGGMAIDLTERKVAGAALRESETRFRHMADNVPVLIWMNGPEGCEFVNREYLRFVGAPLEDVLGLKWNAFVHPDDLDTYMSDYVGAYEARRPYESQCRLRRADGVYRWVRSNGVPRFAVNGQFLGYVGSSVDITESKESEDALKEADRRKDEFLATLAHELRNPLAPMRNALRVMDLAKDDPEAVGRARETMERQLRQMVHLVDDLLDVSRISRGKIELRRSRVDLMEAVQSAVETSRPLVDELGHRLTVGAPVDRIFVDADVTRLAQVFANLLNNAAKYTEPGGHIRITVEPDDDGMVTVTVADDGAGMAPDMLANVFEPFVQADGSLEKAHGGLGIGLTIVRRLVELHGGTVEARSGGPGLGSELVVRLPVVASPVSEPRPALHAAAGAVARRGRRILVADDNEDSVTSMALMLEILGNDVRTAGDGLEAVEVAEAFRPEVILLDLGMPNLNGYDACRRIRERPWAASAIIVAMTGWGQDEDKRQSREAGFDRHLVKPVEPSVVERLLEAL